MNLGYINEGLQIYNRIVSLKDLPDYAVRHSENSIRRLGKNFQIAMEKGYRNDLSPEADTN